MTAALSKKWSLEAHMASRSHPTPKTLGKTAKFESRDRLQGRFDGHALFAQSRAPTLRLVGLATFALTALVYG